MIGEFYQMMMLYENNMVGGKPLRKGYDLINSSTNSLMMYGVEIHQF